MRDVAEAAGVSIKTVSRVVNDQGEITQETRQRVLAAIQELGYRPSKLARALVTQRTNTIGLLIGDIANPYFSEVARGVMDAAQTKEFDVFMCNTDDQTEKRALFSLLDHQVDGAIIYPTYENLNWLDGFSNPDTPMVFVNSALESHPGQGIVRSRIKAGAKLATNYLIERGHQVIAMIAGEVAPVEYISRVQGYREALEANGLEFRKDLVALGAPQYEHGFEAVKTLFEHESEITAIFCYNDLIAMGAVKGCQELGKQVPDDCAIIGFDNILFSKLIDPPLTTIHVDKYMIGKQAAKLLLDMLEQPQKAFSPIYIDSELIIREST
jgi:LacI family transcriptional regulator